MTNCRRSSTLLGFLEYTSSLIIPQTQKSICVKSGERGGNSIGPRQPIHLSENVSSRIFRTAVAKWGGAPSCWKYKLLKSGYSFNAGTMAVFNFSRYFSPETVPLKNTGPTIPADDIPAQTIISDWFSSVAIVKCGFLSLQ